MKGEKESWLESVCVCVRRGLEYKAAQLTLARAVECIARMPLLQ